MCLRDINSREDLCRTCFVEGPMYSSKNQEPEAVQKPNLNKWLIIVGGIAGFFLLVGIVSSAGSGDSSNSDLHTEMYQVGYQIAQSWGQQGGGGDYFAWCNDLANSYYISNGQVNTQLEMDEWIQGCLAYVLGN